MASYRRLSMKSAIAGRTIRARSWQQWPLSSQMRVSTGPLASAAQFAQQVRSDIAKFGKIAREAGIRAE